MNIAYFGGMIVGIAVVAIVILLFKKKLNKRIFGSEEKAKYDERQLIEQGKAGKMGMYFLMVYNAIFGIIDVCFDLPINTFVLMFAGIILTVTVYATICIWNEAYFPVNQSIKRWIWLLFGIGTLNAVTAIFNAKGPDASNELINTSVLINILCVVMCYGIVIISIIKLKAMERATEDDDDEIDG